jgi:hypothetical protein
MTNPVEAAENPHSTEHVDINDKASIARWAKALGTTDEALVNAVCEAGTRVDKVKDYLGAGGAGDQSGG